MARQRGFVLLAATGAILVGSLMLAGWYHRALGELEKAMVDSTRDAIIAVAEVLYKYRLENNNTWPSSMSALSSLAPELSAKARNGVGQPITLVPPSPPSHPTDPIAISTNLLDTDLADEVRSEFPGQARAGTTSVVEIEIPIPGHEPGQRVQDLLVRDGTRDMTGNLDMDGNSILDVRDLHINTSLIVGGQRLDAAGARFANAWASLNCRSDAILTISGGRPGCRRIVRTRPPPRVPVVTLSIPAISIAGGSPVTEGGDAVFTLSSTVPPASDLTVVLAVSDDPSEDYLDAGDEGRKTLTFPAGASSATWSVPTVDDGAAESDGLVTVSILAGTGYTIGGIRFASVRVSDNDGGDEPETPAISVTGGSAVTEGYDAIFIVRASRASAAAIDIALDVSDDATSDFLAASSEGRKTVTLPAGSTWARYPVPTVDDGDDEPDGRVAVRIAAAPDYRIGSPGSDSVTVRDDDPTPPGIPEITIRGGTPVTEGGNATFTVRASRTSAAAIDIALDVSDDATSDFLAASSEGPNSVTLPAGHTSVRYSVPTVDDAIDEPDGQVMARIVNAAEYTVGSRSSASVTVRDDDAAPPATPRITITGGSAVTEGQTAVFTLQADRAPTAPIAIGLEISDDATSDFLAASSEGRKTAALARGSLMATYSVGTVDDTTDEPNGQIAARIVSGAGYAVGTPSSGSVTVRDDDSAPPVVCPRPDDLDSRAGWNADTCKAFCGAETWDYSRGIRVSVGVTQRRGLDYATYSSSQPGDCSDTSVYSINDLLLYAGSGSTCGIWSIYDVVGPGGANFYGRRIQQPQQYTLPGVNPLILTCGPPLCFSLGSEIIRRCGDLRR